MPRIVVSKRMPSEVVRSAAAIQSRLPILSTNFAWSAGSDVRSSSITVLPLRYALKIEAAG